MKVSQLIERLKELPQDVEIGSWIKTLDWTSKELSFEEAGKAIRLMLNMVGKPTLNYNQDASGRALPHRTVYWKKDFETQVRCAEALGSIGITDAKTDVYNGLSIRIPREVYVTAFYTSDDPEVWRKEQEKAVDRAVRYAATRVANREKKQQIADTEWEKEREQHRKEWETQQAEKKKAEEEKLRLEALGREAERVQEKLNEVKIEKHDIGREIQIEGD